MNCERKSKYLIEGRLEDVLSLIQILALNTKSHRSEDGLRKELGDKPFSGQTWLLLAKEHQEFFRVVEGKKYPVSLVLRHAYDSDENNKRPVLTADRAQALLNTAIELHDRQIKRQQMWAIAIPIWVALIGLTGVAIKNFS